MNALLIGADSVLNALTLPISVAIIAVIGCTKVLHPNLRLILCCQSGAIFTRAFFRLIVIIYGLFTGVCYCNFIKSSPFFLLFIIKIFLLVLRCKIV